MITAINLVDNSELQVSAKDLKVLKLADVWVKVVDPKEEELRALSDKLDVSINLMRPIEFPKFSTFHLFDDLALLYLSAITSEFSIKDLSKIAVMLGKGFMITVSVQDLPAYESAKTHLHRTKADTEIFIFNNLVEGIMRGYVDYMEMVEEKIPYFESKIMDRSVNGKEVEVTLSEVFDLKGKLANFARLVWYERSSINSLRKCNLPFLDKNSNIYLEELIAEFTKHTETIQNELTRLNDVVYEYETKTTRMLNVRIERLTDIMKKLTALTVILTIPLVISGHFGMNFRYMPELDMPLAYPLTAAGSVLAAFIALLIFRKKGWI